MAGAVSPPRSGRGRRPRRRPGGGPAPDVRVTLTVRDDGGRITVAGETPGSTLRFQLGDLVEVTLVNDDVADQPGTYWYHSHQVSHDQVRRGLLGALVVEDTPERDVVAVLHQYDVTPTINGSPGTTVVPARAGDTVRVRVVNTDNALTALWVAGAPYVVAAVDRTDLHGPTPSPTGPWR